MSLELPLGLSLQLRPVHSNAHTAPAAPHTHLQHWLGPWTWTDPRTTTLAPKQGRKEHLPVPWLPAGWLMPQITCSHPHIFISADDSFLSPKDPGMKMPNCPQWGQTSICISSPGPNLSGPGSLPPNEPHAQQLQPASHPCPPELCPWVPFPDTQLGRALFNNTQLHGGIAPLTKASPMNSSLGMAIFPPSRTCGFYSPS